MHGIGQMWFKNGSYVDGIWEKGLVKEASLKVVSDCGLVEEIKGTFEYQRFCRIRTLEVDFCPCCQNDYV